MKKIVNAGTYVHDRSKSAEPNNGKSHTQPNMSYTVHEIIKRHQQGLPLPKLAGLSHSGDIVLPNVKRMDFVERDEYLHNLKDDIRSLEEKKQKRIDAIKKAKKEREDAMRNAVEQNNTTDPKKP